MQAPVLKKYPAKLKLTSFTYFFRLLQFLLIAGLVETDFEHWKIQSGEELFTILYAVFPFHLPPLSFIAFSAAAAETRKLIPDKIKEA